MISSIPDLDEVRSFSNHLHGTGKHLQGEIFGWSAEYTPERRRKPVDSKMAFTPAEFWIGESGIWFFSRMWEQGKDKEPVEFLDDRGIVKLNLRVTQACCPSEPRRLCAGVKNLVAGIEVTLPRRTSAKKILRQTSEVVKKFKRILTCAKRTGTAGTIATYKSNYEAVPNL